MKSHPYFRSINWDDLEKKTVSPPFKPDLHNAVDVKYFNKKCTSSQCSLDSLKKVDSVNTPSNRENGVRDDATTFTGFSYDHGMLLSSISNSDEDDVISE